MYFTRIYVKHIQDAYNVIIFLKNKSNPNTKPLYWGRLILGSQIWLYIHGLYVKII
jgi:hypothetical protein